VRDLSINSVPSENNGLVEFERTTGGSSNGLWERLDLEGSMAEISPSPEHFTDVFEAPHDLANLQILMLSMDPDEKLPEDSEVNQVRKALKLVQTSMVSLVDSLRTRFEKIDDTTHSIGQQVSHKAANNQVPDTVPLELLLRV
jgi:hypothetical protein